MKISIIIILLVITFFQASSFLKNRKSIAIFKNIFPRNVDKYFLNYTDEADTVSGIGTYHSNSILNVIFNSINNYLSNNKGAVSDFHLIKDIVDRNCDSKEEEINSQTPTPIYLGLTGTMLGILIGVGSLVLTGGLDDLINTTNGSGVEGIEGLLSGVALAMISSIIGILLNITASRLAKEANSEVEENKNTLLSWMQAELLPNLSNDTSGALVRMTNNLSNFNKTFSDNTKNLGDTFSKVNNSYKNHVSLIHAIDNLKITDIATANISVYEKLKNSTDEIGVFAEYLEKTNEYLTIIQNLSQNLGDYERRTRILEDAGSFFKKNENWLADNIDSANLKVETAVQRFDENTEHYLSNLRDSLNQQILKFDEVINEQQTRLKSSLEASSEIVALSLSKNQELFEKAIALQQESFEKAINYQQKTFESKLEGTSTLVNEIKSISHIKEGVKAFEKETKKQSDKIDALTKEIRNLAISNSSKNWSPATSNNGGNKTNGGYKEKETWGQKLKKGLKRPFSKRKK